MLTRSSNHTLTEQLAERFAERIRSRLLPAGTRLPSVRECARQQGVSPYTVVAAYDQLQAQGLVEARSQRGFFVRHFVQNGVRITKGKVQCIALRLSAITNSDQVKLSFKTSAHSHNHICNDCPKGSRKSI